MQLGIKGLRKINLFSKLIQQETLKATFICKSCAPLQDSLLHITHVIINQTNMFCKKKYTQNCSKVILEFGRLLLRILSCFQSHFVQRVKSESGN